MSMLPKAIYRVDEIPIKILTEFFRELEQIFLRIVWNTKDHEQSKQPWERTKLEVSKSQISWYTTKP